jgi:flagellar secretion chaperone FliS
VPVVNPYARYQQTAVRTADQGDLLILTYEAILRWLGRAEEAIDARKMIDAHEALLAAQDLVYSLTSSLDHARGGEVALNLASLYDFIQRHLVQANVEKNKALISSIRELLAPLLDAWRAAVPNARKEGHLASV